MPRINRPPRVVLKALISVSEGQQASFGDFSGRVSVQSQGEVFSHEELTHLHSSLGLAKLTSQQIASNSVIGTYMVTIQLQIVYANFRPYCDIDRYRF